MSHRSRSKDAIAVEAHTCVDCQAPILVKVRGRKQQGVMLCPGCLEARVQQVQADTDGRGYGPRN